MYNLTVITPNVLRLKVKKRETKQFNGTELKCKALNFRVRKERRKESKQL